MEPIEVRLIRLAPAAEIIRLYRLAGWWDDGFSADSIPAMLAGSWAVAGAFDGDRLIGFGRAIADGASDGYIQDIVVDPVYRSQGIGGRIVDLLRRKMAASGIDWIGLVGAPGTEGFYRRLGFTVLTEHVPMRYAGGAETGE